MTPGKNPEGFICSWNRPCIVSKADWDEKSDTECHQRTLNDHVVEFEGTGKYQDFQYQATQRTLSDAIVEFEGTGKYRIFSTRLRI